jgi:large subunit ribosomal protein L33
MDINIIPNGLIFGKCFFVLFFKLIFFQVFDIIFIDKINILFNMAKSKGARIRITLEHRCEQGVYRYHTSKNRRNTTERLELKKYSPVTKKHELFKEIK